MKLTPPPPPIDHHYRRHNQHLYQESRQKSRFEEGPMLNAYPERILIALISTAKVIWSVMYTSQISDFHLPTGGSRRGTSRRQQSRRIEKSLSGVTDRIQFSSMGDLRHVGFTQLIRGITSALL